MKMDLARISARVAAAPTGVPGGGMRDPKEVTKDEFLQAVVRVPADSWKHMLSVTEDGRPQSAESLWGSFEDACGNGPLGDPAGDDEDEGDAKAREEWLREIMTLLGL